MTLYKEVKMYYKLQHCVFIYFYTLKFTLGPPLDSETKNSKIVKFLEINSMI